MEKKTNPSPKKVVIVATGIGVFALTILALLVPSLPIAHAEADFSSDPSVHSTKHISRLQALLIALPTLFDLPTLWDGQPTTTPESSLQPPNPTLNPTPIPPQNHPLGQRLFAIASAAIWILAAYALGSLATGTLPRHYRATRAQNIQPSRADSRANPNGSNNKPPVSLSIAKFAKRTVIGHCLALLLIAVHAKLTLLPSLSSLPILALVLPCVILLFGINHITSQAVSQFANSELPTDMIPSAPAADQTWIHRWSRRLVGISFLTCLALSSLTLLGSTLPTYDIDVRQEDWLAVESSVAPTTTKVHYHNSTDPQILSYSLMPSLPPPRSLPSLGIAQSLQSFDFFASDATRKMRLLNVLIIGQAVDAWMFLIAVALVTSWAYRSLGALAGWTSGVLLVSHPGVHELVRLGLGAGLATLLLLLALLWLEEHSCTFSKSKLNQLTQREYVATPIAIVILCTWSSFPALWIVTLPLLGALLQYLKQAPTNLPIKPTLSTDCSQAYPRRAGILISGLWICIPIACAIRIFWQWRCGVWGEPLSSIYTPQFALSTFGESIARMLLLSPSNHWLLIPLAIAGGILSKKATVPIQIVSSVRMGIGVVGVSWALWFLVGAQLERQWVIVTVALLPAAAAAVNIFQRNLGAWFCIPIGWSLLTWACIAIPTWPYCDQRLLAPLHTYTPSFLHPSDSKVSTATPLAPWYSDWVDAQANQRGEQQAPSRWWVIGTCDVFFWRIPTCIQSWRTPMQSLPEFSLLTPHQVGYILVDYEGIEAQNQRLDRAFPKTPKCQPEDLRIQLEQWVQQGFLQRCDPWDNSQRTACYKVISTATP